MTRNRTRCGFLGLDVVLATGLTLVLFVAVATAYRQVAAAERQHDLRTRLRLAAEAELLRLRASGLVLDEDTPTSQPTTRHTDDVVLETTTRPGDGDWSGLTHVTVVARTRALGGRTRVELTAYLSLAEVKP